MRVRIAGGTLSPEGVLTGIEAKLALGVAYDGWPAGCDLPSRVPLGHPDALLFYKAAHTVHIII